MKNGRLDRALLISILAAVAGLYWQPFSMNQRLSGDIADVSERLPRVETHLVYIAPGAAGPALEQTPND